MVKNTFPGSFLDTISEPQNHEKLLDGFISNDLTWKENLKDNEKSLYRIVTSRIIKDL